MHNAILLRDNADRRFLFMNNFSLSYADNLHVIFIYRTLITVFTQWTFECFYFLIVLTILTPSIPLTYLLLFMHRLRW